MVQFTMVEILSLATNPTIISRGGQSMGGLPKIRVEEVGRLLWTIIINGAQISMSGPDDSVMLGIHPVPPPPTLY